MEKIGSKAESKPKLTAFITRIPNRSKVVKFTQYSTRKIRALGAEQE